MSSKLSAVGRGWPTWHYLLVAALSAVALVVCLATTWPLDLLPFATLLTCLLLVTRFGRWNPYRGQGWRGVARGLRDEILFAGFVVGILFIVLSSLVTGVMTGQPWLSAGASVLLRLAVVALGVSAVVVPVSSSGRH